ncbi:MAG TPA: glycosyltransferase family 87 protein [Anaerolineae bacterium]|nr:glycosyltransferase family 87 protein [Anaerolineae bacterium]
MQEWVQKYRWGWFVAGVMGMAFVSVFVINLGLIWGWGLSVGETVLESTHIWYHTRLWDKEQYDSWAPMGDAYRLSQDEPDALLYSIIFFERQTKFQYPPTSLLVQKVMDWWQPEGWPWTKQLNQVSWWLVGGTVLVVAGIFVVRWRQGAVAKEQMVVWWVLPAVMLMAVSFYPMLRAFRLGQIQVWINFLAAVLVLAWLWRAEFVAGIVVGLICLMKPQYGLIYIWGVLRKRWRFAVAGAVSGGVGSLLSLWIFGWRNHWDYLPTLSYMSRHGEVFFPNQSVNGLLNRWLLNGDPLGFQPNAFAPYEPVVYVGTLVSSLLLVGACLYWPRGLGETEKKGGVIELCIALLSGTMASPIAWEHHYGVLLPIFALLLAEGYVRGWGPRRWLVLAVAYLLSCNLYLPVNRLAYTSWNWLLSYLFWGALMVLGLLYFERGRRRESLNG